MANQYNEDHTREIDGLDSDSEQDYVCLCHKSRPELTFKFLVENLEKSTFLKRMFEADQTVINNCNPVVITTGNMVEFMFVIKYLDFYNELKIEADAPEMPLSREKTINEIFEFEYIIFKDLFDMDNVIERFILLKKIIHLVNFLDMEKLLHKMCAIVAYFMTQISDPDERINLAQALYEMK
jgi:hypothetical protein